MKVETIGKVISIKKQWWLKINTKPIRLNSFDGAIFPHVLKVAYEVDGKQYVKRKWLNAGIAVPALDSFVKVVYFKEKPSKATILL